MDPFGRLSNSEDLVSLGGQAALRPGDYTSSRMNGFLAVPLVTFSTSHLRKRPDCVLPSLSDWGLSEAVRGAVGAANAWSRHT